MRWIFSLLLLANAIFFVWQGPLESVQEAAEVGHEGVSDLRLLSEIDTTLLLTRNHADSAVSQGLIDDSPGHKDLIEEGFIEKRLLEVVSSESDQLNKRALERNAVDGLSVASAVDDVSKREYSAVQPSVLTEVQYLADDPVTGQQLIDQQSSDQTASGQFCQMIGGLKDEAEAQHLLEVLLQTGVLAEVKVFEIETVLAFELIIDQPNAAAEKAALMNVFAHQGMQPKELQLNGKAVYVLGRFSTRNEVDEKLSMLEQGLAPRIYQVVRKDSYFEVWIELDEELETPNKINLLASDFSREIKIEKKSCKGVASAEGRD